MPIRKLNRWQAFLTHFGISLIIFVALLAIIIFVWYPGVFIHMGGWQGIKIVAAVDLILGPFLTLIIFNPTKKSLPIDLSIIALIQLSCLGYGVWTIEQQRPVTQILLDDRLHVIPKAQYKAQGLSLDFLEKIPGPTPKMVMLDLPTDHIFIANLVITGLYTDNPVHLQTPKYLPISSEVHTLAHKELLAWQLNRLQLDQEKSCYWLPADSTFYKGEVCFSSVHGAISQRDTSGFKASLSTRK